MKSFLAVASKDALGNTINLGFFRGNEKGLALSFAKEEAKNKSTYGPVEVIRYYFGVRTSPKTVYSSDEGLSVDNVIEDIRAIAQKIAARASLPRWKDDKSMQDMYREDANDMLSVAEALQESNFKSAYKQARKMDTAVRDYFPREFWVLCERNR